ncbi:MAG: hypothetical protein B7Y56_10245 [Gallionellales bacterium 35-53-114]|jgi:hypothetical protein|nr:MAG: hypothetical protein B7Y56_10245 [Gallionellales bacterium 35-53-114]OYZ62475.1 MAG: hypothetical protein B7Y04_14100 [Gallionellales bacterium 24-53-125]OZB08535.1 MAG: hypothetical protein B7X61_10310 [Gallionellales bacterium 39-52-133]HQS59503.1 twin transmembrane helix small protein [Gallionellaceae bacterium]HQS76416.1 twin transmembrane helix small protein [Gallionellaceae bacterium]
MLVKIFIIVMLILIVGSLFSALTFLYKDNGQGERTAKALTLRISLSIVLFLFLMLGFYLGFIPARG